MESIDQLTLPAADDLHVHLRQDAMMQAVAPQVRAGGVGRCLVMPNTTPPVAATRDAVAYRDALRALDANVEFLMTLYLTPALTPDEIRRAAEAGITGVKLYPRGVTTHSDAGVEDLEIYGPVFEAMQETGMVLEIHGETPSDADRDICVLNAEETFLPQVERVHRQWPQLRIVLEHITTAEAVAFVKQQNDRVGATITAHHLELTVDDWAGRNHNFCKPVAKFPHDRRALREVVAEGLPRFFLGSDSAPHPRTAKECATGCAGVFTSPLLMAYLADTFERLGCLDRLADFTSRYGREFYGLPETGHTVTLRREPCDVPGSYGDVVPFRAGDTLAWTVAADDR